MIDKVSSTRNEQFDVMVSLSVEKVQVPIGREGMSASRHIPEMENSTSSTPMVLFLMEKLGIIA